MWSEVDQSRTVTARSADSLRGSIDFYKTWGENLEIPRVVEILGIRRDP
jgi:hypothetical protein